MTDDKATIAALEQRLREAVTEQERLRGIAREAADAATKLMKEVLQLRKAKAAAEHRAATAEARVKELEDLCELDSPAIQLEGRLKGAHHQLQEALAREAELKAALVEAWRLGYERDGMKPVQARIHAQVRLQSASADQVSTPSDTAALIEAGRLATKLRLVGKTKVTTMDESYWGFTYEDRGELYDACAAIVEKERGDG